MAMNNITELPVRRREPNEMIFTIHYFVDDDEVAIPRLPSDPDVAGAIIGTLVRLLILCRVLTPSEAIEAAEKGAGKGGIF
jgi:hypothetical protein